MAPPLLPPPLASPADEEAVPDDVVRPMYRRRRGAGVPWPEEGDAKGLFKLTLKTPAAGQPSYEMECGVHPGCKKTKVIDAATAQCLKVWALKALDVEGEGDRPTIAESHFALWPEIWNLRHLQICEDTADMFASQCELPPGFVEHRRFQAYIAAD